MAPHTNADHLTFTIGRQKGRELASVSTGGARALPPEDWFPVDGRNRFNREDIDGLKSYLPGHASLSEIVASRVYYVMNGCIYDEEENFVVMMLRPIGWGCRMAFFLFSVVFCLYTLVLDTNPVGKYNFSRGRDSQGELKNSSHDPFEMFVLFVFVVWVLSIFTSALSYLIGRYGAKNPYDTQMCATMPFWLFNRAAVQNDNESGARCAVMLFLTVWWLGLAASASTVVYTAMAHMYVTRNMYFALLLLLLLLFVVLATFADVLSLGGPTGIYVQSSSASWICSVHAIVIVPVQAILTLAFAWMCYPDWAGA